MLAAREERRRAECCERSWAWRTLHLLCTLSETKPPNCFYDNHLKTTKHRIGASDGSEWIGIFSAVCGGSDERQFPSSHEVHAQLGVGEYLAGVDYFCFGRFPHSAYLADRARSGAGLCLHRGWAGAPRGDIWGGLGHLPGLPG